MTSPAFLTVKTPSCCRDPTWRCPGSRAEAQSTWWRVSPPSAGTVSPWSMVSLSEAVEVTILPWCPWLPLLQWYIPWCPSLQWSRFSQSPLSKSQWLLHNLLHVRKTPNGFGLLHDLRGRLDRNMWSVYSLTVSCHLVTKLERSTRH